MLNSYETQPVSYDPHMNSYRLVSHMILVLTSLTVMQLGIVFGIAAYLQDNCSLFQLQQPGSSGSGARLILIRCVGHQGVMQLARQSGPKQNINFLRCTNCRGCKECSQPVPLVITEGTGGSGCPAEVAAKAEALHAEVLLSKKQKQQAAGTAGSSSRASEPAPPTSDNSNPVLVECGVCHRKPGDPGVPATLKLCGRCQQVRYCSTECQRKDWKLGHKILCQFWFSRKEARQQPK
jgi:hypothetical protein